MKKKQKQLILWKFLKLFFIKVISKLDQKIPVTRHLKIMGEEIYGQMVGGNLVM